MNNVEQARALSWDDKMKVWIHYMVEIVALNVTHFNGQLKVKSFDEFCKGNDDGVSESLVGHYWRFKDKIFKE